jgi:hypothetical membrane protein
MPSPRAGAGPALWLASAQFFVVQVVVAGASSAAYSWSRNTISDLGDTDCGRASGRPVCSPLHLIMNASFVVLGVTMLAGAALVARELVGRGRTATTGLACLGLGGVGTIVVGLFPENTVAGLHAAGAALPFVLGNLGILLLGLSLRLPVAPRVFTLAAGVVGLVGLALFLSHTYLGLGIGGMERVTAYPQDIWLVLIGAYLLVRGTPPALANRRV